MPLKIFINGKSGRMGQEILALAVKDSLFEVVESNPDIYIDFSAPVSTIKLLSEIEKPVVIGTTGFTGPEIEQIAAYSKKHPVFFSSNMSVGMNLFFDLLKRIPSEIVKKSHVVLNEEHHQHKKDSPSGTAKKLLSILNHDKTEVKVLREGEIFGNHSIRFILEGEEFEISHKAFNRTIFAKGALKAAEFLSHQKNAGLYENF